MMARFRLLLVVAGFGLVGGAVTQVRGETSVTVIGTTPVAACARAAAEAKLSGIGTRSELDTCNRAIEEWAAPRLDMASAYVNRSVIRIARGELAAALADATTAIGMDDALAEAYLNRGIVLAAEGQAAAAMRDFSRSIALHVSQPELAYFDRAIAREDGGDIKGAYFDYRRAAELNPHWDKPQRELARFTVVRNVTS